MTKFDEAVEEDDRPFGRRGYSLDAVSRGRWVNPVLGLLGTLFISGYLMRGYSSTSTAPADESTFSSMPDLLKAALGATLALAWAVGGAWFGMRRASMRKPLDEPADDIRMPNTGSHSLRAPTCERMYDETRLVPHYLRCARFPAMKQDLVRLASEHTDEGQALRRLERIPERRYSSLHDLIREIRVD